MSGGDGIVMVYGTLPTLKEIAGAVGDVLGVNDPEVRLGHGSVFFSNSLVGLSA